MINLINSLKCLRPRKKKMVNKKLTQREMLIAHLQSGKSITPLESLQLYGIMACSQRIGELKEEGFKIETETEHNNGKHYARYRLKVQTDLFTPAPPNSSKALPPSENP